MQQKLLSYFFNQFYIFQDEHCLVVYISFDPFSLIDQAFNVFCGLEEDASRRLKSMSISDAVSGSTTRLETLYGFTSPPTSNIGDVLTYIQEHHQGQLVHFLIDEFNQEFLTTEYGLVLSKILKDSFSNSTVVIALQSVSKQRTVCSAVDNQDIIQQTTKIDFQSTGMELFQLKTAVRMSKNLFELQKSLESEVESSPFKAALAFKGKPSLFSLNDPKKCICVKGRNIRRNLHLNLLV